MAKPPSELSLVGLMTSCIARADEQLRGGRAALCELPLGEPSGAAAPNNPAPLAGSSLATCHKRGERYCLPACTNLGQDPTDTKFHSFGAKPLMSFTADRPLSVDSPSLPLCVRFNVPLRRRCQHYGFTLLIDTLQHSILGLWLRATHAGTPPLVIKPFPVRTCILLFK